MELKRYLLREPYLQIDKILCIKLKQHDLYRIRLSLYNDYARVFTSYSTAHVPECGGTFTTPMGHFQPVDADADGFIDDHLHCLWQILAGSDEKVQLTVSDVDIPDIYGSVGLRCKHSFLQVRSYTVTNTF